MGQESGRRTKVDLESLSRPRARPRAPGAPGAPAAPAASEGQDEHQGFNSVVGDGIRHARQEHGWTQAFLAEQARLSPNYIARLERGELGPSLFVANRICEALAIDLEALVVPPASAAGTPKTAKRRAAG